MESPYQVMVDATTMSPADIAAGLINIDVFVATVCPAEFLVVPIQIDQKP